jgi:hypothetical protein
MLKSGQKWQQDSFLCTPDAASSSFFAGVLPPTMSSSCSLTSIFHLHNTHKILSQFFKHFKTTGVCCTRGLAIFMKILYHLKAKEEELLWKNSNIPPCQKYNLQRKSL